MTLFSQENNISPNQKYKITELYLYRPIRLLNRYGIPIPATSSFHYDRDFYLNISIQLTLPLN